MIRSKDGSVFVGGNDGKLNKLDKNFKFVSSVDLKDLVYCGMDFN